MVPLLALGMAKTALYELMREEGVGRAELARRLRCHLPEVSSLLYLRYASGWSTSKRLSQRSGRALSSMWGSPLTAGATTSSTPRNSGDRISPLGQRVAPAAKAGDTVSGSGLPLVSGRNGATTTPRMKNKPTSVAAGP